MIAIQKIKNLEQQIDLNSIENFFEKVNCALTRKNVKDRRIVELGREMLDFYKTLEEKEKNYFVTRLWGEFQKYADLWQSSLDNPETTLKYKKFLESV